MIFTFRKWDNFCKTLLKNEKISVTAKSLLDNKKDSFIVLKHDVETNVKKALIMAKIENKYHHRSSFYVQAYLLNDKKKISMLKEIQAMGHEITYHYDVMDSNKGDIEKALIEFEQNKKIFEHNGFIIETVCQHGNPLVERKNYTSNRDFFRSEKVKEEYPNIFDVMVDFKSKISSEYLYYSDAGRQFKFIYDPINNDRVKSDDKNISYKNLDELFNAVSSEKEVIISSHPHRWCKYSGSYLLKSFTFKVIKGMAKLLFKIPFFKKLMSKYYYLAKKI